MLSITNVGQNNYNISLKSNSCNTNFKNNVMSFKAKTINANSIKKCNIKELAIATLGFLGIRNIANTKEKSDNNANQILKTSFTGNILLNPQILPKLANKTVVNASYNVIDTDGVEHDFRMQDGKIYYDDELHHDSKHLLDFTGLECGDDIEERIKAYCKSEVNINVLYLEENEFTKNICTYDNQGRKIIKTEETSHGVTEYHTEYDDENRVTREYKLYRDQGSKDGCLKYDYEYEYPEGDFITQITKKKDDSQW